jgi:lipoprotein-releasing system permease protein
MIRLLKKQTKAAEVMPQSCTDVLFSNGYAHCNGQVLGVDVLEQGEKSNILSTTISGMATELGNSQNGIILGESIAKQLALQIDDRVTVTTPDGAVSILKLVGIFTTTASHVARTQAFATLSVIKMLQKSQMC